MLSNHLLASLHKSCRFTNQVSIRQLSILQQPLSHRPQLLLSLHRPQLCQHNARNMSTMESMYMKLISLPMVHTLEDTLAHVHDTTGLPWWATIMASTAMFRLLFTLPAHVTQQKVMAKRYLMSEEMKTEVIPSLQRATNQRQAMEGWSKELATSSGWLQGRCIS